MILDKEVGAEQNYAQGESRKGHQVEFPVEFFLRGSLAQRSLFVFESENLGNPTFGSRGITGSNDNSGLESSSAEIRIMNLSGVESAGSWSTPSRNLLISRQNGEGVAGVEIQAGQPTDVIGEEGIVDLDSFFGVDDVWVDDKNPVEQACSQEVDQAHDYRIVSARKGESNYCGETDQENNGQVDPTGSWSVNVSILHNRQTTSEKRLQFSDLDTKKGAQS